MVLTRCILIQQENIILQLEQVQKFLKSKGRQHKIMKTAIKPDKEGFYGEFGGAYIPEMLYPNIHELQDKYLAILGSPDFREDMTSLLKDYAGRPTPLYYAERLSEYYETNRAGNAGHGHLRRSGRRTAGAWS